MLNALKFISSFIFLSSNAYAGWTSGGGQLFKDVSNPWFVQNTKVVSVCLEIDEANFGVSATKATEAFQTAVQYWKSQAKLVSLGNFGVTEQNFIIEPCSSSSDLTLKLGKLNHIEAKYLRDPKEFVAVTIRTQYNLNTLKAKGFIYVSPEAGLLKISGDTVVEKPWSQSNGILLTWVLTHELGHVFGVNHTSGLMAADFPEKVVSKSSSSYYGRGFYPMNFLRYQNGGQQGCQGFPGIGDAQKREFLGIPNDWKCTQFRINQNRMEVLAKPEEDNSIDTWTSIGKAPLKIIQALAKPVSTIFLPKEQTVFKVPKDALYLHALFQVRDIFHGLYTAGNLQREIGLYVEPSGEDFSLSGIFDGKLVMNAPWSFDLINGPWMYKAQGNNSFTKIENQ